MTKQVFLQPIYDDLWWITILVVIGIILYLIFGATMRNPKPPQTEPQSAGESRKSRISHAVWELSERLRKEYGINPVIYAQPERVRPSYLEPSFRMRFQITGQPASAFGVASLDPLTGKYQYHYLGGYWEWANHFTPRVTGKTDWDGWTPDESA